MASQKARPVPDARGTAETRVFIDLTQAENSPPLPTSPKPNVAPRVTHEKIKNDKDSAATCLQKILDIFPDISIQYGLDLIREASRTSLDFEHIVAQILDRGSYPKERDERAKLKRKRESENIGDPHNAGANLGQDHQYWQEAKKRGEMAECRCCYEEFLINRMIYCDGDMIHFFCRPCARTYVEAEIGMGRCKLVCFADSDCSGAFTREQLQQFLGEKSFERLEHMKQQQELAAAKLDFLSECPFCDFKAECRPIEVDKEFRCENPKCSKISCRLCQNETHVPLTCEEMKQDGKLAVRHVVEEAMSEALIRHCNKCRQPFIKDSGCNKMRCTRCGKVQCYVCSKDVRDYRHFNEGQPHDKSNRCPLHDDDINARHEEEVKRASEKAKAKVQSENPEVTDQDLTILVSDRTKNERQKPTHGIPPRRR